VATGAAAGPGDGATDGLLSNAEGNASKDEEAANVAGFVCVSTAGRDGEVAGGKVSKEDEVEKVGETEAATTGSVVPVFVVEGEEPRVRDGVGVAVAEGLTVPVELAVLEALPVLEGEAPSVRDAVGVPDSVDEALSVELLVESGVRVAVGVGVALPVGGGVGGGVALPDSDVLPVWEAEAPQDSDAVGDCDWVELADWVVLGVRGPVPVPLPVQVPVGVPVGVGGGVPLLDREVLPVEEAEAPADSEAVGVAVTVELAESVEVGVSEAVPVPLGVGEGVAEALVPGERVAEGLALPGGDVLPVALAAQGGGMKSSMMLQMLEEAVAAWS
jgi:hypothetical protein